MQISKLSLELSTVKHEEAERLYKVQKQTGFGELGRDLDQCGGIGLATDPSARHGRLADARVDSWDLSQIQGNKDLQHPTIGISKSKKQSRGQRRSTSGTASGHPPGRSPFADQTQVVGAFTDAVLGPVSHQSKGKQRMSPVHTLSDEKGSDGDGSHPKTDTNAISAVAGPPSDSLSMRSSSSSQRRTADATADSLPVKEGMPLIIPVGNQTQMNGSLSSDSRNRKRFGRQKTRMNAEQSSNLGSKDAMDKDTTIAPKVNSPELGDHSYLIGSPDDLLKSKATAADGDHSNANTTNRESVSTHAGLGSNLANGHDSQTTTVPLPRQAVDDHYKRETPTAVHPNLTDHVQTPFSPAFGGRDQLNQSKKASWRRRLLKSRKEQTSAGDGKVGGKMPFDTSRFVLQAHCISLSAPLYEFTSYTLYW